MISVLTGLAAGATHVVTGPDHIAAVAPLAMGNPRNALKVGLRWGAGHAMGVGALGLIGMGARSWLNVEAIAMWAEASVGVLLIMMGIWALKKARGLVVHSHGHDHDHDDHEHVHVHVGDLPHEAPEAHVGHSHAPFWIGLLHGTAGSGHLLGLLPSLALPPAQAVVYLSAYLIAGMVVMCAVTWALGALGQRGRGTLSGLMHASAIGAIALGAFWLYNTPPLV